MLLDSIFCITKSRFYNQQAHDQNPDDETPDGDIGTIVRNAPQTKKPSMYKVLMLNDDYTPMEFVIQVLKRYFHFSQDEATKVMLQVHHKGVGLCGVFTHEVAEMKVTQTMNLAREYEHPLQCLIEKDETE